MAEFLTELSTAAIDSVADKSFYGFRYDPLTAKLTVEKINDDSPGVVRLPHENQLRSDDYKHWVWTDATLIFAWNPNDLTRLTVEVL